MTTRPYQLLIGCGSEDRGAAWHHHDRVKHSPHIDLAFDLNFTPWPIPDATYRAIVALDVLEHLPDTVAFMDECHRILVPGGTLELRVPDFRTAGAWADPTHRRAFTPATFHYFDPETPPGGEFGVLYTDRPWRLLYSLLSEDRLVIEAKLERRAT